MLFASSLFAQLLANDCSLSKRNWLNDKEIIFSNKKYCPVLRNHMLVVTEYVKLVLCKNRIQSILQNGPRLALEKLALCKSRPRMYI